MSTKEFIEAMRDYAKQYGEVVIEDVNRANITYTGLMIRKMGVPTPVINLDALYKDYKNDKLDLNECFSYLDRTLSNTLDTPFNASDIVKWEKMKDRLYIRLFGELKIKDGVYRKVADLFEVPYIQVLDDDTATTRVTNQLMDAWGVSEEEVFKQARKNQITLRPARISSLAETLGIPEEINPGLYIVSTESGVLGAGCILYEGIEDRIKEKIGGDFYILPSSIHEVIVVPKDDNRIEEFARMVRMINTSEVDERDRLSNSVYGFEKGEFVKVSA